MGTKLIESKKDKMFVTSLGILAGIIVILTVIFIIVKIDNNRYISEINQEKDELNTELKSLSKEYENLETNNDSLKVKLSNEQDKINILLEKMKVFRNNSYAEIARYKKEVNTLKTVLRSYVIQIDSLNQLNKALIVENNKVKQQMKWAKTKAQRLQNKNKKIEKQLSKAAALEAIEFEVYPINKKGRKLKKVRKCVKLKAVFALQKNITAKRGLRKLYLRIHKSDNSILPSKNGTKFKYQGKLIECTANRNVEYEGERLEVAIFWDRDKNLVKGNYAAYLFSENYMIGKTSFRIK